MPLPAPDFEQLFAHGARHTMSDGDIVTVRLRQDTSLWLPSGRVVAAEPSMFGALADSGGFVQRVPPGHYPLVLVIAVFGEDADDPDAHSMIAAARLVIRAEPVVAWEMAVYEGQDASGLGDDEYFYYPVDGGSGGFVDAQNIAALCADYDDYLGKLMDAVEERDTDHVAPGTVTGDDGEPVVVMFSSGGGDGRYPTWIGRTADGEVACVLTDFFILPDGDLLIEDAAGREVWSSGTAEADVPEGPVATGDRMLPGQTLGRQSLTSPSGRCTFVHQDDGNLVLYDNDGGGARWASGTQGRGTARCVLHENGDLALYDKTGRVVWSTGTAGHPGSVLTVQAAGLELRAPDGTVLWSVAVVQGAPANPFQSAVAPSLARTAAPMRTLSRAVPARPLTPARPAVPAKPASAARPGIPAKPAVPATPASVAQPLSRATPSQSRPAVRAVPTSPAEPAAPAQASSAEDERTDTP